MDVKTGRLAVLVGAIYCDLPIKPNVLRDLAEDNSLTVPPNCDTYCSAQDQDDFIVLEDMSGRISLVFEGGELPSLVTGSVVAVLGTESKDGSFHVQDHCYALEIADDEDSMENDTIMGQKDTASSSKWIAFMSGICMDGEEEDLGKVGEKALALEMAADYLTGDLCGGGDDDEDEVRSSLKISLVTFITFHLRRLFI